MCDLINQCLQKRNSSSWCQLNEVCVGWGCRHILVVPNKLPASEQERAKLFSSVYKTIERTGIKNCPFFNESIIDKVVEDDTTLAQIMSYASDFRTVLLSEDFI